MTPKALCSCLITLLWLCAACTESDPYGWRWIDLGDQDPTGGLHVAQAGWRFVGVDGNEGEWAWKVVLSNDGAPVTGSYDVDIHLLDSEGVRLARDGLMLSERTLSNGDSIVFDGLADVDLHRLESALRFRVGIKGFRPVQFPDLPRSLGPLDRIEAQMDWLMSRPAFFERSLHSEMTELNVPG